MDLKEELQLNVERYAKLFAELMKQYDVKEAGNVYDWRGNKDEAAITKKIDELLNSTLEVKNTNFLDSANFIKVIPDGLSLNELSFMGKYLKGNKFNTDLIQMQIDSIY